MKFTHRGLSEIYKVPVYELQWKYEWNELRNWIEINVEVIYWRMLWSLVTHNIHILLIYYVYSKRKVFHWDYDSQFTHIRTITRAGVALLPVRYIDIHGALARYVKLRVAHAPGMPGTFPPQPRFSNPDMHHGTRVTHVPWCMSGSLTSGFLWSRWRRKRSRHSRRMRN